MNKPDDSIITTDYKGHPIIAGEVKRYRYNQRHLSNNLQLLEAATSRHNKVYSWRMDIRLPQNKQIDKPPKKIIKDFMSAYTKKLARRKYDPDYVVKMERDSSDAPHFHIQMITDGNKVKDYRPQLEIAEKLLAEQLELQPDESSGLIENCNNAKNGIMIRRTSPNFDQNFDQVYKQMSYLAKQKDGDAVPSDERKIFYSKFRRDRCRRCK